MSRTDGPVRHIITFLVGLGLGIAVALLVPQFWAPGAAASSTARNSGPVAAIERSSGKQQNAPPSERLPTADSNAPIAEPSTTERQPPAEPSLDSSTDTPPTEPESPPSVDPDEPEYLRSEYWTDRQYTVSGTVKDSSGIAVPGATVTVRCNNYFRVGDETHFMSGREQEVTADLEGHWSAVLDYSHNAKAPEFKTIFSCEARAVGFAPSPAYQARADAEGHAAGVAIELAVGGVISGRLIDATGAVFAGLKMRLSHRESAQWSEGAPEQRSQWFTADEAGNFEVRDLPAGDYEIDLTTRGYEMLSIPKLIRVRPGHETRLGDILVEQIASLSMQLLDTASEYYQPITLDLVIKDGDRSMRLLKPTYPDREGFVFVDGVPIGEYELEITLGGYQPKTVKIKVEAGKQTAVGEITLEPIPAD